MILETERLIVRPLEERDRAAFLAIQTDPNVKRFFPSVPSRTEANDYFERFRAIYDRHRYSLFAAELKASERMIGTVGMLPMRAEINAMLPKPAPAEIGWTLDKSVWGKGLAPEGARACIEYAWNHLNMNELVAFTYVGNDPSRRVMEKLGMTFEGEFNHPLVPPEHHLNRHFLFRITKPGTKNG
jgi:RimJ/RimL family protein N-acetyltransferase